MRHMAALPELLTLDDVIRDLEVGRSLPLRPAGRLLTIPAKRRPTVRGRSFWRTYGTARALGRIHPRLARRSLLRLWFTPWVHPSALQPVEDLPADFFAWSIAAVGTALHGYTGGTGPTVVLVHGWAGRAADWRYLAGDLITAGWRVVVPDLPAHGMTPGERTDLFELGRAVAAVLQQERPAAVIAHSLGFPMILQALQEGANAPPTIVALAPARKIAHAVEGFAHRTQLPPTLVKQLRGGLEDRFGPGVWDVLDADRLVPTLAAKGLVIHDTDDEEVPVADGQHIADRWADATFVATTGLGHRRILREETVRTAIIQALS